jgi:hypothetical protein
MLLSSAAARAIIVRSSALRARNRPSSQALRCARAALASSSPAAVALKSTLRPSRGSRVRTAAYAAVRGLTMLAAVGAALFAGGEGDQRDRRDGGPQGGRTRGPACKMPVRPTPAPRARPVSRSMWIWCSQV